MTGYDDITWAEFRYAHRQGVEVRVWVPDAALANCALGGFDLALLRECGGDGATVADRLLALETVARRYEEHRVSDIHAACSGVAQPTKGDDPVSDDDPYRFRCAHSAYACEDVRARVVELETALRDLVAAWERCRAEDLSDYAGSLNAVGAHENALTAARRVLGDRPTEETK